MLDTVPSLSSGQFETDIHQWFRQFFFLDLTIATLVKLVSIMVNLFACTHKSANCLGQTNPASFTYVREHKGFFRTTGTSLPKLKKAENRKI